MASRVSKENERCEDDDFPDDNLIFLNDCGHSIHFVLLIDDSTERDKLMKRLKNHLGCVHTNVEDIGPHSIVLTDDSNMNWTHDKVEIFKIRKPNDAEETISISIHDLDYHNESSDEEIISKTDIDNDSFMDITNISSNPLSTKGRKNTGYPYSRTEKEAIVKFIIDRRCYDRVKSNEVWKELERWNTCPTRTWRSLKNHAIRSLSKEIRTFRWLSPTQSEQLNNALLVPSTCTYLPICIILHSWNFLYSHIP